MSETLPYECPLHTERRALPPRLRWWLNASLILIACTTTGMLILFAPKMGIRTARWMALGPAVGCIGLYFSLTAQSVTQVFSDGIRVKVFMAGLPVWRRQIPWPDLLRCEVLNTKAYGFKVLGFDIGRTVIMFGGDGVRLHLANSKQLMIGSDQPSVLTDAIEKARLET